MSKACSFLNSAIGFQYGVSVHLLPIQHGKLFTTGQSKGLLAVLQQLKTHAQRFLTIINATGAGAPRNAPQGRTSRALSAGARAASAELLGAAGVPHLSAFSRHTVAWLSTLQAYLSAASLELAGISTLSGICWQLATEHLPTFGDLRGFPEHVRLSNIATGCLGAEPGVEPALSAAEQALLAEEAASRGLAEQLVSVAQKAQTAVTSAPPCLLVLGPTIRLAVC